MASSSTSSLHDHLTTNVLQFLESHPAVTKVHFLERQPVKLRQLTEWEHQNGLQLPRDLRAFYSVTDGFAFTWSIKMKDEVVPLGNMNINSLAQMRQFKMKQFRLCGKYPSASDDAPSDDEDAYGSSSSNASSSSPFPVAFDLDSTCRDGHVALIYTSPTTSGIYFQDPSSRWYFVANKFIEYQRLMMMHVGIPNWQYAFTDQGMPNETKHWFAFLSPQRLSLDLLHARPTRTPQTGTNASGRRTVPNGSPAHSQQSIDLAKIDALAASITALQPNANLKQKATSVTNGASIGKKATHASGTDDEEEEEEE